MERTIEALDAGRQFGKVLQEVVATGDQYVVEQHGEPVAAVVPIEVFEQWKRSRSNFFDRVRAISERSGLSPEEADRLAEEAVRAVRAAT
ncbi:MAG TPA: type II toxin-antitoxin system Phd/YefM family antitoxin [Ardenticatenaceae bacterium]|jgi:prevent-host-death family protein